jgi:hypothetical protein
MNYPWFVLWWVVALVAAMWLPVWSNWIAELSLRHAKAKRLEREWLEGLEGESG